MTQCPLGYLANVESFSVQKKISWLCAYAPLSSVQIQFNKQFLNLNHIKRFMALCLPKHVDQEVPKTVTVFFSRKCDADMLQVHLTALSSSKRLVCYISI